MYLSEFQQNASEPITVYIDILLFVNLVINGVILFACAKLTGARTSFSRFAIADAFISAYGLTVCLPPISFTLSTAIKSLAAVIVSMIAFKTKSLRSLLKNTCIFLFCSFCYVAVLMSIQHLPFCKSSIYIQNSEIYFNISVPTLLIAALFLLLATTVASRISASRKPVNAFCNCQIKVSAKTVTLRCFRDSGNLLKDPITGDPVMIAEKDTLKDILPNVSHFKTRIIPYHTADGKTGIMTAFRPDNVKIDGEEKKILIAISDTRLGDEFNAIIGTKI